MLSMKQLGEKVEENWASFKEFKFVFDNSSHKDLSLCHSLGTYLSSLCWLFLCMSLCLLLCLYKWLTHL